MKWQIRLLTLCCVGSLTVLALGNGCQSKGKPSQLAGKAAGKNLLLITLDTTRADRIGCYGYKAAQTPTIDALAQKGVLFENAFAQVPLTLPAHASMLTGRYPREHGIRDNGRNALADTHPTLATLFKEQGYATGAFIAAFVLDKRFGLNRGFDVYSDDMGEVSFETQPLEWQLDGKVVTQRALDWLETVKSKPFFAWVHYYDAHDPHVPPPDADRKMPPLQPDPAGDMVTRQAVAAYDIEISYLDQQVRRLIEWLEKSRLLESTVIVIIGDHGESFKEHGVLGHTTFVHNTNLQIPFIVVHPGIVAVAKRCPRNVGQVDLFPTVLELFGLRGPSDLISRSLAAALEGNDIPDEDIYSESLYALNSYNWAEQRSLTTPEWKYISSTSPKLFDRRNDPGEQRNLVEEKGAIAAKLDKALRKKYRDQTAGQAAVVQMDEQALRAIQSLGYSGTSRALGEEEFLTAGLPDPADLIHVVVQFKVGLELLEKAKKPEDVSDTLPLLRHVVEQSPGSVYFQHAIGSAYLRIGDLRRAYEHLHRAIEIDPYYVQSLTTMAQTLAAMGQAAEAEKYFLSTFEIQDNAGARAQYGELLMKLNRFAEAREQFRKAIELFPTFATAHARLADALRALGQFDEALQSYQTALAHKSDLPAALIGLGVFYAEQGQLDDAIEKFSAVTQAHPEVSQGWLNLGKTYLTKGDLDRAETTLRRALEAPDARAEASYALGVLMSRRGRLEETIRLYEQAIAEKPTFIPPIEELAQHYFNSSRPHDAARILEIGVRANPADAKLLHMLGYLLGCGPDGARDGARALQLARQAVDLTGGQEPFVLQTLAIAQAEVGDFEAAIQTVDRAMAQARTMNRPQLVQSLLAQRSSFEARRPFRDSRFGGSPVPAQSP